MSMDDFRPLDWYLNEDYPNPEEFLGGLPRYINSQSTDPIWLQLNDNSRSGWHPNLTPHGFELSADEHLLFPGFPPLAPAAYAWHLGEKVLAYPAGWICLVQLGGAFSVARVR
jgi:hypothetical protein